MKKEWWVAGTIVGGIIAVILGAKWLGSALQNKTLTQDNDNLRRENANVSHENDWLRQQNTNVAQENSQLKNQVTELSDKLKKDGSQV